MSCSFLPPKTRLILLATLNERRTLASVKTLRCGFSSVADQIAVFTKFQNRFLLRKRQNLNSV